MKSQSSLSRTSGLILAFILSVAFLHPSILSAGTQGYFKKPISIINPWGPGTALELFSRAISPKLSKMFGVPVDVVSKPGGSSIIGTHSVMMSKPDGCTILCDGPGSSSMQIAWETEVWVADAPSHLIHFNVARFLGPYIDKSLEQ